MPGRPVPPGRRQWRLWPHACRAIGHSPPRDRRQYRSRSRRPPMPANPIDQASHRAGQLGEGDLACTGPGRHQVCARCETARTGEGSHHHAQPPTNLVPSYSRADLSTDAVGHPDTAILPIGRDARHPHRSLPGSDLGPPECLERGAVPDAPYDIGHLVSGRQPVSTPLAASSQDGPTGPGRHPMTKPVVLGAFACIGLICAFHYLRSLPRGGPRSKRPRRTRRAAPRPPGVQGNQTSRSTACRSTPPPPAALATIPPRVYRAIHRTGPSRRSSPEGPAPRGNCPPDSSGCASAAPRPSTSVDFIVDSAAIRGRRPR